MGFFSRSRNFVKIALMFFLEIALLIAFFSVMCLAHLHVCNGGPVPVLLRFSRHVGNAFLDPEYDVIKERQVISGYVLPHRRRTPMIYQADVNLVRFLFRSTNSSKLSASHNSTRVEIIIVFSLTYDS